jgi:hypothetical protein
MLRCSTVSLLFERREQEIEADKNRGQRYIRMDHTLHRFLFSGRVLLPFYISHRPTQNSTDVFFFKQIVGVCVCVCGKLIFFKIAAKTQSPPPALM